LAPALLSSLAPSLEPAPSSQLQDFREKIRKNKKKVEKYLVSRHWEPQEPAPLSTPCFSAPGYRLLVFVKVVKELLGSQEQLHSFLGAALLPLLALWLWCCSQILGASSQLPVPHAKYYNEKCILLV